MEIGLRPQVIPVIGPADREGPFESAAGLQFGI